MARLRDLLYLQGEEAEEIVEASETDEFHALNMMLESISDPQIYPVMEEQSIDEVKGGSDTVWTWKGYNLVINYTIPYIHLIYCD